MAQPTRGAPPVDDPTAPEVRPTVSADVAAIARLHRRELHHGLYPRLGERFLRHYHRVLLDGPHVACHAVGPLGAPDGFVVTLTDPAAHRRWLRGRRAVGLALAGLRALTTHPDALWLFLRTRLGRYLRALVGRSTPTTGEVPAVLLHVAVGPAARGDGVGAALVDTVLAVAAAADREVVRLVTEVGSPAEPFYERLGWDRVGIRPGRDGTTVAEYEHRVQDAS